MEATAPPARTPDPSEALTDELARARRELAEMDEQWRTTPPQEVLEVQRIIDVACEACLKAENAGLLSRAGSAGRGADGGGQSSCCAGRLRG